MNPITLHPNAFWLLVFPSAVLLLTLIGRNLYELLRYTKQQRIDNEAQRLMLRFCKNPTRANWSAAWDYISYNEVLLYELDWPLVQRFTRTAVSVNFSPGAN